MTGGEASTPSADARVLLPYRLRTVRIAVQSTVLALAAMVVYPLLPHDAPVDAVPYALLIAAAGAGCFVMSRLPWPRLFDAGWGIRLLYVWSMMDILLITWAIAITGHADSELFLVYALTTIFFAASYPPRGQTVLMVATCTCYVGVLALFGWELGVGEAFIRVAMLAVIGFMGRFLSRELMAEMADHATARAESERRAGMLARVAGAARSMSTLDSERVLGIVADTVVELGFDGAEICMFDEASATWSVPLRRGIAVDYDVQRADAGLAGEVRRRRTTMVVDDYAEWAGGVPELRAAGFHSTIAAPVWSGSELVGVVAGGSFQRRPILAYEKECLELLAAQAGAALVNAHRFTERRRFEEQLQHQAFHDVLTGLPNRALFVDRLQHALARMIRDPSPIAVLFLDLDRFKTINDSLGHDLGDVLLVEVASRLRSCLRPADTLARYGGDEFTVLLEDLDDDGAIRVADRILEALHLPFRLADREVFIGTSIGIAFAPSPSGDQGDPLREADLAMYRAKERGRGRWEIFQPELGVKAQGRLEKETELAQAVEHEQFVVYYQPIVALDTGLVTGVEALVRWRHPRRGLVGPGEFIPLAEETGLIVPLGRWVLQEAARQAREWQLQGMPRMQLHVNLSPVQFRQRDLVDQVADVLGVAGLPASRLTLEITESAVVDDFEAAVAVMDELRRLGVRLALDDFGQGYSALGYIKRFPLDSVKIDRGFVEGLVHSPEDRAIVRSVTMLAVELGMTVTAEGIESQEQLDQVRALGCDAAQGFYLSAPLPGVAVPAAASPDIASLVEAAG